MSKRLNKQEIEFTPMEEFEFWLDEMEDKVVTTVKKPATRAEATELLETAKVEIRIVV